MAIPSEQLIAAEPMQLFPHSRKREFWAGVTAVAPLLLGAMPFGLIYGVLAVKVGLSTALAQGMSSIVFAGSAQFITAQLMQDGTPLLVIIITAAVLNLRHMLYSASIAPHLQHLNRGWKTVLAYLLTDEAYAVAITRYWIDDNHAPSDLQQSERQQNKGQQDTANQDSGNQDLRKQSNAKHWYVLGTGLGLWVSWQISTAVGVFLGAQIPASWSLDFAVPLTFIALVMPALRDRAMVGAATVAGITALLTIAMPLKLGLVTAMVVGIGAGWLVQQVIGRGEEKRARG